MVVADSGVSIYPPPPFSLTSWAALAFTPYSIIQYPYTEGNGHRPLASRA